MTSEPTEAPTRRDSKGAQVENYPALADPLLLMASAARPLYKLPVWLGVFLMVNSGLNVAVYFIRWVSDGARADEHILEFLGALAGGWLGAVLGATAYFYFRGVSGNLPVTDPDLLFLRPFAADSRSQPLREAISLATWPGYRVGGISNPRRRAPSALWLVAQALLLPLLVRKPHIQLVAWSDWPARLVASLRRCRGVIVFLPMDTPAIRLELSLAVRVLGPERIFMVVPAGAAAAAKAVLGSLPAVSRPPRVHDWQGDAEALARELAAWCGGLGYPPRGPVHDQVSAQLLDFMLGSPRVAFEDRRFALVSAWIATATVCAPVLALIGFNVWMFTR